MVKIYSMNGNESRPIGRMDDDGRVYNALEGGLCVGEVDQYGMVHIPPLEGEVVGLVGCDGKVYEDGELSPYVGRTDAKGMVHDSVDDNHIVARVEGEPKQHAGAAFLLLKDELMNPLPF